MTIIHFNHFSYATEMGSSFKLNFAFPCGLCSFHIYKELWNPRLKKMLDIIHEENNPRTQLLIVLDTLICQKVSACEIANIKQHMIQNLQNIAKLKCC